MKKKARYAVVGLGHIAQTAVLPAFKHAQENSELVALVSGDPTKLEQLGRKYKVKSLYSYEQYEECLRQEDIDVVYIATPNTHHQGLAEIASSHGVHVLCEKPLATTEEACVSMLRAARRNGTLLMTAYRLHFDPANLEAIRIANSGEIGDLRIFSSNFTMQVTDPDNIRLTAALGGGPLYDIGIYCINAARYIFRDEPLEVYASSVRNTEPRFDEVDEMTSVVMKFPNDRLATFTASFGAAETGDYTVIGTKGRLHLENAYDYAQAMKLSVTKGERTRKKTFKKHDQFAPELVYFSNCVTKGRLPEPSGLEGLADVRVIQALLESSASGKVVKLDPIRKHERPTLRQKIVKPAVTRPPREVHVTPPH